MLPHSDSADSPSVDESDVEADGVGPIAGIVGVFAGVFTTLGS